MKKRGPNKPPPGKYNSQYADMGFADATAMMMEIVGQLPAHDQEEMMAKLAQSHGLDVDAVKANPNALIEVSQRMDEQMSESKVAPTNASKRRNLGRGLGALLGEAAVAVTVPAADAPRPVAAAPVVSVATPTGPLDRTRLPIESLTPGPFQPRRLFNDEALEELAQSIREQGVLQPLLARPHPSEKGTYQIIGGERRWRAAQKAGLHEVPVIVRDFSDREAMEVGIIENVQRQDLTALEEAEGFNRLLTEFGHTHEALAKALGKSRAHVSNAVRLLKLPQSARDALERGDISAGHARVLVAVENPQALLERILKEHLSVRLTEDYARASHGDNKRERKTPTTGITLKNPNVLALEKELTGLLGLKVQILAHGQSGTLMIKYNTLDQLEPVLAKLRGEE